jgi:hypothetical protein
MVLFVRFSSVCSPARNPLRPRPRCGTNILACSASRPADPEVERCLSSRCRRILRYGFLCLECSQLGEREVRSLKRWYIGCLEYHAPEHGACCDHTISIRMWCAPVVDALQLITPRRSRELLEVSISGQRLATSPPCVRAALPGSVPTACSCRRRRSGSHRWMRC